MILKDHDGLHHDSGGMWYITRWGHSNSAHPPSHSDHFDLDHYDFYNSVRGNFELAVQRGDLTIGELAEYGNRWASEANGCKITQLPRGVR